MCARADDPTQHDLPPPPPADAELGDSLTVMLGFEVQVLNDGAATTETASQAVADSIPRRVSWEGNVMEVIDIWPITAEILAEAIRDPGDTDDDQPGDDGRTGPDSGPGDEPNVLDALGNVAFPLTGDGPVEPPERPGEEAGPGSPSA